MKKVSHFLVVTAFATKVGIELHKIKEPPLKCSAKASSSRKCKYGTLFICRILKCYRQGCILNHHVHCTAKYYP